MPENELPPRAPWAGPTELLESPSRPHASPSSSSSAAAPPALGRIGRYELERMIHRDGTAEVFLARTPGIGGTVRRVIVKRIRRALAEDQKFLATFQREARLAGRLQHPCAAQVLDVGQEGDEHFVALEPLEGLSLNDAAKRAWARGESIPLEVILAVIADAARGLQAAHTLVDEAGRASPLVHRDVGPDSIFITKDGVTTVTDFGLARTVEPNDLAAKAQELHDKIPFMAPEQIRGEPIDARTDLFALGVTLYWLLTGERPFKGATDLMAIEQVLRHEARPPRDLNPHVPVLVQGLVLNLLAKDPAARPEGADVVAERAQRILASATGGVTLVDFIRARMRDPALAPGASTGGFVLAAQATGV